MTQSFSDRIAVVLFNLGGPDKTEAVRPFLYNLFKDPNILRVPSLLRRPIAWFIAAKRAKFAREVYERLGGKSPLLENTEQQADALQKKLLNYGNYKVFVAMRYWHPFTEEVVASLEEFDPQKIILLPLYPQFSSTTTASSFDEWDRKSRKTRLKNIPTIRICCYPDEPNFIAAHAGLIRTAYWDASESAKPRILFSAHGLPKKIIEEGDPYQWQVEKTVHSILAVMNIENADFSICYQSRVGPLEWLGPSTDEEIQRAGQDKVPVVLVPVAFVSEHSETLVELDMEYGQLAKEQGVPIYIRVPALGVDASYIEGLAQMCLDSNLREGVSSACGERICPKDMQSCLCIQQGSVSA